MKSPDDPIDEELRKALKSRFDHFERIPDAALTGKVFKKLPGNNKLIYKGLAGVVLLLTGITVAVLRSVPGGEVKTALLAKPTTVLKGTPAAAMQAPRPAKASNAVKSATASRGLVATVLKNETPAVHLTHDERRNEVAAVQAIRPRRSVRKELQKLIDRAGTDNSLGAIWIGNNGLTPEDGQFVNNELQKIGMQTASPDLPDSAGPKITERVTVADQDIGVLDHKPLSLPEYEWRPDSLIIVTKLKKLYDLRFKERWGIITAITPLRTFQILTVRPGNGVIYQNFVFPTKISAETVGYKFWAGVEKSGFQLLVNYGQFKQSYKYEIATDEYVVGPNLSGNYQVVRKGIPQQENSTVRMLGISVKKHTVRRSSFLRNYYGDVGAEFSRDFTSGKNLAWVNAGFGKELPAGPNGTLIVGPYLEYSFMKLSNPDNPFRIQPYQVGLSVGLRFNKK